MATFQFRLASVLRFRQRLQEEKQWELGLLLDKRRRKEDEIVSLSRERQRVEVSDDSETGRILLAMELRCRSEYAESLILRVENKGRELRILDQEIASKRTEVVEALRSVRTLERLRERWAEKFYRAQASQEQKFLDELGARKFARRNDGQSLP